MPARKKSFLEFVADGTFLARRHAHYLEDGTLVREPRLRRLQKAYQAEESELERRAIAISFEKTARELAGRRGEDAAELLAGELAKLGPAGSADQVVKFFPRFLRHDDEKRFRLERWQQDFVRLAYRQATRRRETRRVFKEILLGIPRGNGKTPLAAGLGLHALLTAPGRPRVFQIAGAKDQAALGIEYAHGWIEDGDLAEWLRPASRRVARRDGRGRFDVLPAGGGLGHGRKPDIGIVDEWWQFATKAQNDTFTALETALHKKIHSYLLELSTAGWTKLSQLGEAFDSAFKLPHVETHREGFQTIAWDEESGRLMVWYGLPEGYDLDLEDDRAVLRALKLANPGGFVDHHELLRALRRTRDVNEWRRFNLNDWTKTKGQWVAPGVWSRLEEPELQIPAGAGVYVAVDAAHSYDTTAVAWAWKRPNGQIVVRAYVFSVREDAPHHELVDDFYDEEAEEHVAESLIYELAETFRIREIVADPNYFDELNKLGRRFNTADLFPSSNLMVEAVQSFYRDLHNSRRLRHDGDRVVAAHVTGIGARKDRHGYWRIYKLDEPNPIDAGVAIIMAASRAALGEGSAEPWGIVR